MVAADAHRFSVHVGLLAPTAQGAMQKNPVARITLTNVSQTPIMVGTEGAFFDYSATLLDSKGRPVPLTKEGHAIRFGSPDGFVIANGHGAQLGPGQSTNEDLDLRKYFDIKAPGKYKLQVERKFIQPPETVSSNVLAIDVK
jgi:hypothetical protein